MARARTRFQPKARTTSNHWLDFNLKPKQVRTRELFLEVIEEEGEIITQTKPWDIVELRLNPRWAVPSLNRKAIPSRSKASKANSPQKQCIGETKTVTRRITRTSTNPRRLAPAVFMIFFGRWTSITTITASNLGGFKPGDSIIAAGWWFQTWLDYFP